MIATAGPVRVIASGRASEILDLGAGLGNRAGRLPGLDAELAGIDLRGWRNAGNLRYDSGLRSAAYMVASPVRALRKKSPRH